MKPRSFKLLKWFPTLPKDWEVGMELGIGDNRISDYSPCNLKYKDYYLEKGLVEDNPEFFEEIIERHPLLITHDGVELFEGDSVWGFYTGFGYIFEQIDLKRAKEEQWLKFSSREKAEDYIILNKPVLSINDLKNIRSDFPESSSSSVSVTYGALRQLVKSRL